MNFRKQTLGALYPGESNYLTYRNKDLIELLRYSAENFPKILQLADRLKQVGEKHDATAGQVALAWLLAQGEDIIPIPGTTKIKVALPV